MVALSPQDIDRAKFHTGMCNLKFIPAQDYSRLLEACNDIEGNYQKQKIITQLDRCDEIWDKTNMTEEAANEKRLYSGDINRAEVYWSLGEAMRLWNEVYLRETDRLSRILNVPNYHRTDMDRYRFERPGAVYINALPGPKDTAVFSNVGELGSLVGGFGY